MLKRLTATQFIQVMTTGRTSPLLCGCSNQNGAPVGEFVVKLLGRPDNGGYGALFEIVASRLAKHFGILVPEAAVVEVTTDFAQLLSDSLPALVPAIKASVGPNFGTRVISPMSTWFVGRVIPEAMFADAAKIFAFDALIQNVDRRTEKPNLFTQGDNLYVYDHENSFSFLFALGVDSKPWILERDTYLDNHPFYSRLKSKKLDLDDFKERLTGLTDNALLKIRREIPDEWIHEYLNRIESHLTEAREHADEFVEQVTRRLV